MALILSLPLLAMRVTDEVVWTAFDFALAGALLFGTGVAYELATRVRGDMAYRAAVGVALVAGLTLAWVNGAVGVIGSDDDPANLMFGGVLAVGMIGAIVVRFQPDGMARALFATALAQALVAVIVLIFGFGSTVPDWPRDTLMLSGFFAGLWLTSAWLFRQASRERS
ncbi:MAG TPA: hypothetical protein QF624_05675 [Dehalococcoidia bacterium]|nr:hypothetical protein [Dehalococcoidia bacterium]